MRTTRLMAFCIPPVSGAGGGFAAFCIRSDSIRSARVSGSGSLLCARSCGARRSVSTRKNRASNRTCLLLNRPNGAPPKSNKGIRQQKYGEVPVSIGFCSCGTAPGRTIAPARSWSITGQHTGTTDLPLTEHGRNVARRLKPLLASKTFALVLTSPLKRALETCELSGLSERAAIERDLMT